MAMTSSSFAKRKRVDEPSALDAFKSALHACAETDKDALFDVMKEAILQDSQSTCKFSRDTAFMGGLFSEMGNLEYDRPVDAFETVRLLQFDPRSRTGAESCTVYVKAMPAFFGGCIADLIRMRHTCTIERLIQEDEKRLDLTNDASLHDFLWRFNGSLFDVRQDVLRRVPVLEVRRNILRHLQHLPRSRLEASGSVV